MPHFQACIRVIDRCSKENVIVSVQENKDVLFDRVFRALSAHVVANSLNNLGAIPLYRGYR